MNDELLFQYWLVANFDHPYSYGNFIDVEELDISFRQDVEFITRTFNHSEELLAPYSNGQLRQSLWYLASNMHEVSDSYDEVVNWHIRQACIQSFKSLNEQIFAKRCSPETSAYKNPALDNPLNGICYMWWDIFAFWESLEANSTNRVDAEFIEVMAYCLTLEHVAVIEGALHGLNHIPNHRQEVKSLIDTFLRNNPDSILREYAEASKLGANL